MIPFNERLLALLNALNVKSGEFAKRHKISRVSMGNFLSGQTKPSLETLERICSADPRISTDYLLRGTGSPLHENKPVENADTVKLLFDFQKYMNEFVIDKVKELTA